MNDRMRQAGASDSKPTFPRYFPRLKCLGFWLRSPTIEASDLGSECSQFESGRSYLPHFRVGRSPLIYGDVATSVYSLDRVTITAKFVGGK